MSRPHLRRFLRRHRRRDLRNALIAVAVAVIAVAAAAHAGAHRPAPAPTRAAAAPVSVSGTVATGEKLAAADGWSGEQWNCLYDLWERESGWNVLATYPSAITPPSAPSSSITTAYGIAQALPAQKMAAAGPDWRTSAATQIRWGLGYVRGTYGMPCAAWAHELADGWY